MRSRILAGKQSAVVKKACERGYYFQRTPVTAPEVGAGQMEAFFREVTEPNAAPMNAKTLRVRNGARGTTPVRVVNVP